MAGGALTSGPEDQFCVGGDLAFRFARLLGMLWFDVIYKRDRDFQDVARALHKRWPRLHTGSQLEWQTERLDTVLTVLRLPRNFCDCAHPVDALVEIFDLKSPTFERSCKRFLDVFGPPTMLQSHFEVARSHNIEMLRDWISVQTDKGVLILDDPDHAARMLLSMMFGTGWLPSAAEDKSSSTDNMRNYLLHCIELFVRGCSRRSVARLS